MKYGILLLSGSIVTLFFSIHFLTQVRSLNKASQCLQDSRHMCLSFVQKRTAKNTQSRLVEIIELSNSTTCLIESLKYCSKTYH